MILHSQRIKFLNSNNINYRALRKSARTMRKIAPLSEEKNGHCLTYLFGSYSISLGVTKANSQKVQGIVRGQSGAKTMWA